MEPNITAIGKLLLIMGGVLAVIGLLIMIAPKVPWIGRLPGDIYIKKDNFVFYFPLATCILLSLLIYFILRVFRH